MATRDLSAERLRELFRYCPETGVFTRITAAPGGVKAGQPAGCAQGDGRIVFRVDGRLYKAHRLAWLYMTGGWPAGDVDHINGDHAFNAWRNLRDVSHQENIQNQRGAPSNNRSSGLLGVTWQANRSKWKAQICVSSGGKRKNHHLGLFDTAESAHAAYIEAKRALHAGNTL